MQSFLNQEKMADAFVSFAVQKLGDFLIQEISLRTSLRDEVRWLRNELLFMQSFLKDAEQKQSRGDQRVQQWIFEINSIANDSIAILETYSFETGKGDDDGFASRLKACACICRMEKIFYNVSKEIQSLKQRIMDISRKRETYGITNIDNNAGEGPSNRPNNQSPLRRTTCYVDDRENIFVGFQDVVYVSVIKFSNVFRYIYVLYLDIRGGTIPAAIGSLYHLKFLRLEGHHIHDLPSSIGNLKNLQTLPVSGCRPSWQLPTETADLINLRHLVAPYSKPLKRISKLTCLQVLEDVCCDQWKDVDPVDLVNLQELSMDGITKSYSLNNISSLKNLSTLRLLCKTPESFPALEFLNYCQKLQKLWLKGRIEKLPFFPNSITMMVLLDSRLMEDPMPILEMLPNLRNLDLDGAYDGKEIMCSDNSFSQLRLLHLERLWNLERWNLATSAMPLIRDLCIHSCPKLYEIPERMKDVKFFKNI